MDITKDQLMAAVPALTYEQAVTFVAYWQQWAIHFGITTKARAIHLLSQIFAETGALHYMSENMNYSREGLLETFPKYFNRENVGFYARNPQKIGNRVYANRMGNGSEASGDGYRYRGRGLLMLTGRSQYEAFNKSDSCMENVIECPEKVAQYPHSLISALWFWKRNNLNAIADLDTGSNGMAIVEKVTRKVNGGTNGLAMRRKYYTQFKNAIK